MNTVRHRFLFFGDALQYQMELAVIKEGKVVEYLMRIESSSYYPKFFFEIISKIVGISKMELKQTVQKLRRFEKMKKLKIKRRI